MYTTRRSPLSWRTSSGTSARCRPPRTSCSTTSMTRRSPTVHWCSPLPTTWPSRTSTRCSRTPRKRTSGTASSNRSTRRRPTQGSAREEAGPLSPDLAGRRLASSVLSGADRLPGVDGAPDREHLRRVPADLARSELRRRRRQVSRSVPPLAEVCFDRHGRDAGGLLSAGLLDRLPGRPPQDDVPVHVAPAVLRLVRHPHAGLAVHPVRRRHGPGCAEAVEPAAGEFPCVGDLDRSDRRHRLQLPPVHRSEEHTSELQSR